MYCVRIGSGCVEICITFRYAMIELKYVLRWNMQWLSSNVYCDGTGNDGVEICIALAYGNDWAENMYCVQICNDWVEMCIAFGICNDWVEICIALE